MDGCFIDTVEGDYEQVDERHIEDKQDRRKTSRQ